MNPNIAANQQRLFLEFMLTLRPHLRKDSGLPRRIKELLGKNRSIGSRDRKLYRELIYTALRYLPWVEPLLVSAPPTAAKVIAWLAPELKATSHYRAALCGDWPETPATLAEKAALLSSLGGGARPPDALSGSPNEKPARPETGLPLFDPQALLPSWFREHSPAAFESPHLDAIHSRARVWVRLQCQERSLVLDEFRGQGWDVAVEPDFPDALSLPPNAEVASSDAYRRGFVEIQDLGSQMVLASATAISPGRWLDACAGAGGKTLQLARLLGPTGHVDATDIRPDILEELRDRATRARLTNITLVAQPGALYDGVLIDAPCSGSGTWRRQPHLKWHMQPDSIAKFAALQGEILRQHAHRVRPGGQLVYATCSLSHHENQDVVTSFLHDHPEFVSEQPGQPHGGTFDGVGTSLLPGTRNTDGFYVAWLRKAF